MAALWAASRGLTVRLGVLSRVAVTTYSTRSSKIEGGRPGRGSVDHAVETALAEAPAPFVDRIGGYPQVCRELLV
jgi:hypothetical protein